MVDGVGALFSRHNFKAQPDVVPLMFRATEDDAWPRGLACGRYVHNVLIVNHGLAQIRTAVHVVEHVERLDLGDTTCKHIDDPVAFAIQLGDGPSTSSQSNGRTTPYRCRPSTSAVSAGTTQSRRSGWRATMSS